MWAEGAKRVGGAVVLIGGFSFESCKVCNVTIATNRAIVQRNNFPGCKNSRDFYSSLKAC